VWIVFIAWMALMVEIPTAGSGCVERFAAASATYTEEASFRDKRVSVKQRLT